MFHAIDNPTRLSAWQLFRLSSNQLVLNERVVAYELNSPLFSDYAHKLRTITLPDGLAAEYSPTETFDFPVGTIISKTFYYPSEDAAGHRVTVGVDDTPKRLADGFDLTSVRLIETRILVHRAEGWVALPYVWNEEQTEAVLKRAGAIKPLRLISQEDEQPFNYLVPNVNQCAGCHATNATSRKLLPIGPKARHLNRESTLFDGMPNQLQYWASVGMLKGLPPDNEIPANAAWDDQTAPLDRRARAYLDINCAHCHNAQGAADTSGLHLEATTPHGVQLGLCKPPIAAGTGTGDRRYDIVPGDADASIFTYRMASDDPAVMMPELGRAIAHNDGVSLIAAWINAMPRACSELEDPS
ncbi:MAG: SO2930 family diheme c-type cytochrome [Pseudomonadota bacterium]